MSGGSMGLYDKRGLQEHVACPKSYVESSWPTGIFLNVGLGLFVEPPVRSASPMSRLSVATLGRFWFRENGLQA